MAARDEEHKRTTKRLTDKIELLERELEDRRSKEQQNKKINESILQTMQQNGEKYEEDHQQEIELMSIRHEEALQHAKKQYQVDLKERDKTIETLKKENKRLQT